MAATAQISPEEYLRSSFEGPAPEYLDGELVERHLGDYSHGRAQCRLGALFEDLGKTLPLHAATELHLRIAPGRFRVADLAVFEGQEPSDRIPSTPPLIAIEILSPDDRFQEILDKLEEYRRWGVPHIWFVDPWQRKIYVYGDYGLQGVSAFSIPEHHVEIPAAKIWE